MMALIRQLWWISLIPLSILLVFLHRWEWLGTRGRRWAMAGAMASAAVGLAIRLTILRRNFIEPPQFDFWLYWSYGKAVVLGLDPYDPAVLRGILEPRGAWPALLDELFFFQTPPTLFLFAPLGGFQMRPALALWYSIHLPALAAAVGMMARRFLPGTGATGVSALLAFVLLFHPVGETLYLCQVNFLLLVLLLLFWKERDRIRGGVWLALGALLKPVLGVYLLTLALRPRRRPIAGFAAALGGASLLTIAVFGGPMFVRYFTANPVRRMPNFLYTEDENQSLLATVLRLTSYDLDRASPYASPWFLGIALLLIVTTVLTLVRRRRDDDHALSLTILLGLLLFPKSLAHYAVLMLPALFTAWKERDRWPGGAWTVGALLIGVHALAGSGHVFWAFAAAWAAFVAVGLRDGPPPPTVATPVLASGKL